jgi:D-sedoheptulose 7-phosphate isomerase
VFARQLRASGVEGDVAIGLSTSGNSSNVIEAMDAAREIGMATIAFTGGDGGKLAGAVDHAVIIPAGATPRIQEGHLLCAHILCEIVESTLFG